VGGGTRSFLLAFCSAAMCLWDQREMIGSDQEMLSSEDKRRQRTHSPNESLMFLGIHVVGARGVGARVWGRKGAERSRGAGRADCGLQGL
jgi:hypothetical protein